MKTHATLRLVSPLLPASAASSIRRLVFAAAAVLTMLLAALPTSRAQNFYVANYSDGTVQEYGGATNAFAVSLSFDAGPGPLAVLLSGNTLYVSDQGGSSVNAYDATTGAPVAGFTPPSSLGNPWGLAVSGNTLYVSYVYSNTVLAFDATTGAPITSYPSPAGLNGPTGLSISGNNLYVANFFGGTLGAYDLTTSVPVPSFIPLVSASTSTGPSFPLVVGNHLYVSYSPFGSGFSFPSEPGTVSEYDATTGAPVAGFTTITGLQYPTGLAVSGNTLYVSDTGNGTVQTYDATTGAFVGTYPLPAGPNGQNTPYGLAIVGTSAPAFTGTVVPGTANLWLAPAGATDPYDSIPAESPAFVTGMTLVPGATLSFEVTGSVSYAGLTPTNPPDGDSTYPVTHAAENGVGGVSAFVDGLMGVFLDDSPADPTNASVPPSLDFTDPINGVTFGANYVHLDPGIGQVFFIGDGKTSGGTVQTVTVPAGATRLALGGMDGAGWYNNTGAFYVTLNGAGAVTGTPLTATALTVDGSVNITPVAKGEAITFAVTQGNLSAGVYVRVQATTTPTVENSWTDLTDTTNGGAGFLAGDGSGNYSLTTKQYPFGQVYFRAISAESGQPDSISNVVGYFRLISPDAPTLFITQTGRTADDPTASVAIIGDQITYTLKVYKDGPQTANNVKVTCEVPAGQQLVSIDDSYMSDSAGDDIIDIGSVQPTGNAPLLLHVVTTVTPTANLGQVFSGLGYSVSAAGGDFAQGTDTVTTTVVRPLEVVVTSNSSSVAPGQMLVFQIDILNRTAATVKNVALSIPIPSAVIYGSAVLTDASGAPLPGPLKSGVPVYPVNLVINGTNLLAYLGNVMAGAKDHLTVTVSVPYDTNPSAAITLAGPQVTTKTPVGDSNSFTLPDTSVALSGTPPSNPPHFTLDKFVPDGTTIFELIGMNAEASAYVQAAFPTLLTTDGIQTLGSIINPNVLEITDPDDGTVRQCVYAPGQAKGPATSTLTYGLLFSNDGGFAAPNVVLTDRLPAGTQLDSNFPPTFNGKPFGTAPTLDPDGRTIHFNIGTLQPDKFKAIDRQV